LSKFPPSQESGEHRKYRQAKRDSSGPSAVQSTNWKALGGIILTLLFTSCATLTDRRNVRPLVLRDVPAQRLAYRFEADVNVPDEVKNEDTGDKIEAIQLDFNTRRENDALLRTVR
jgi:hypothetical protein